MSKRFFYSYQHLKVLHKIVASKEDLISKTKIDCFSWLHFQYIHLLPIPKVMKGRAKKATEYLCSYMHIIFSCYILEVCLKKKKTLFKKQRGSWLPNVT